MRPTRTSAQTRRILHYIGRRGAFLAFLALLDVILGLSLHQPLPYGLSASQVYGMFVRVAPLDVWVTIWALTGVLCAAAALWHSARPVAFMAAAALKTLWSLVYVAAWLNGGMPRGYLPAAVWVTFAGLVLIVSGWPEQKPHP